MVSIIICSKTGDIGKELEQNIADTVGCTFELIVIDNTGNPYTIFEAYNEGIRRSQYPLLCFMHEDVMYHSSDWGQKVAGYLADPSTGIIGLAGATYLNRVPSPWFKSKPHYKNLLQSGREDNKPNVTYRLPSERKEEVLCVDGFWFCCRRNLFSEGVRFDTETYDGFHFYDLDICVQLHQKGYRNYVVPDIFTEHSSVGSINNQWIDASLQFYRKWHTHYPLTTSPSVKPRFLAETKAYRDLLYAVRRNNWQGDIKELKRIGRRETGPYALLAKLLLHLKHNS